MRSRFTIRLSYRHGGKVTKARYTLATKSTELATMSTATSCRIQVVADLSPKPATRSTVSATVDIVADLSPVSATVDFVACVYRALQRRGTYVVNYSYNQDSKDTVASDLQSALNQRPLFGRPIRRFY